MKKILALFVALAMVVGLFPAVTFAADTVSYLEDEGKDLKLLHDYSTGIMSHPGGDYKYDDVHGAERLRLPGGITSDGTDHYVTYKVPEAAIVSFEVWCVHLNTGNFKFEVSADGTSWQSLATPGTDVDPTAKPIATDVEYGPAKGDESGGYSTISYKASLSSGIPAGMQYLKITFPAFDNSIGAQISYVKIGYGDGEGEEGGTDPEPPVVDPTGGYEDECDTLNKIDSQSGAIIVGSAIGSQYNDKHDNECFTVDDQGTSDGTNHYVIYAAEDGQTIGNFEMWATMMTSSDFTLEVSADQQNWQKLALPAGLDPAAQPVAKTLESSNSGGWSTLSYKSSVSQGLPTGMKYLKISFPAWEEGGRWRVVLSYVKIGYGESGEEAPEPTGNVLKDEGETTSIADEVSQYVVPHQDSNTRYDPVHGLWRLRVVEANMTSTGTEHYVIYKVPSGMIEYFDVWCVIHGVDNFQFEVSKDKSSWQTLATPPRNTTDDQFKPIATSVEYAGDYSTISHKASLASGIPSGMQYLKLTFPAWSGGNNWDAQLSYVEIGYGEGEGGEDPGPVEPGEGVMEDEGVDLTKLHNKSSDRITVQSGNDGKFDSVHGADRIRVDGSPESTSTGSEHWITYQVPLGMIENFEIWGVQNNAKSFFQIATSSDGTTWTPMPTPTEVDEEGTPIATKQEYESQGYSTMSYKSSIAAGIPKGAQYLKITFPGWNGNESYRAQIAYVKIGYGAGEGGEDPGPVEPGEGVIKDECTDLLNSALVDKTEKIQEQNQPDQVGGRYDPTHGLGQIRVAGNTTSTGTEHSVTYKVPSGMIENFDVWCVINGVDNFKFEVSANGNTWQALATPPRGTVDDAFQPIATKQEYENSGYSTISHKASLASGLPSDMQYLRLTFPAWSGTDSFRAQISYVEIGYGAGEGGEDPGPVEPEEGVIEDEGEDLTKAAEYSSLIMAHQDGNTRYDPVHGLWRLRVNGSVTSTGTEHYVIYEVPENTVIQNFEVWGVQLNTDNFKFEVSADKTSWQALATPPKGTTDVDAQPIATEQEYENSGYSTISFKASNASGIPAGMRYLKVTFPAWNGTNSWEAQLAYVKIGYGDGEGGGDVPDPEPATGIEDECDTLGKIDDQSGKIVVGTGENANYDPRHDFDRLVVSDSAAHDGNTHYVTYKTAEGQTIGSFEVWATMNVTGGNDFSLAVSQNGTTWQTLPMPAVDDATARPMRKTLEAPTKNGWSPISYQSSLALGLPEGMQYLKITFPGWGAGENWRALLTYVKIDYDDGQGGGEDPGPVPGEGVIEDECIDLNNQYLDAKTDSIQVQVQPDQVGGRYDPTHGLGQIRVAGNTTSTGTEHSVTYKVPSGMIENFDVWCVINGVDSFKFEVSADGAAWQALATPPKGTTDADAQPIATAQEYENSGYSTISHKASLASGIPSDMQYLRLTFPAWSDVASWSAMISYVEIGYGDGQGGEEPAPGTVLATLSPNTNVQVEPILLLRFSEDMDTATLIPANFAVDNGAVIASVTPVGADACEIRFGSALARDTVYTLTIGDAVCAVSDKEILPKTLTFRTTATGPMAPAGTVLDECLDINDANLVFDVSKDASGRPDIAARVNNPDPKYDPDHGADRYGPLNDFADNYITYKVPAGALKSFQVWSVIHGPGLVDSTQLFTIEVSEDNVTYATANAAPTIVYNNAGYATYLHEANIADLIFPVDSATGETVVDPNEIQYLKVKFPAYKSGYAWAVAVSAVRFTYEAQTAKASIPALTINADNVDIQPQFTVTFDKNMDRASFVPGSFAIDGAEVAEVLSDPLDPRTCTLVLDGALAFDTDYTLTLSPSLVDYEGISVDSGTRTFAFHTMQQPALYVSSLTVNETDRLTVGTANVSLTGDVYADLGDVVCIAALYDGAKLLDVVTESHPGLSAGDSLSFEASLTVTAASQHIKVFVWDAIGAAGQRLLSGVYDLTSAGTEKWMPSGTSSVDMTSLAAVYNTQTLRLEVSGAISPAQAGRLIPISVLSEGEIVYVDHLVTAANGTFAATDIQLDESWPQGMYTVEAGVDAQGYQKAGTFYFTHQDNLASLIAALDNANPVTREMLEDPYLGLDLTEYLLSYVDKGNVLSSFNANRTAPFTDVQSVQDVLDIAVGLELLNSESDADKEDAWILRYAGALGLDTRLLADYQAMDAGTRAIAATLMVSKTMTTLAQAQAAFVDAVIGAAFSNPANTWTTLQTLLTQTYASYVDVNTSAGSDYANLDPSDVFKEMLGRQYASVAAVQNRFNSVVSSLANGQNTGSPNRPSTIGGGGGGTGGSGLGFSTPGMNQPTEPDTPEVPLLFTDLETVPWAQEAIGTLTRRGVLSNVTQFNPDQKVVREEFVKMIVLALGYYDPDATCSFVDVPEDAWYYSYIASAYQSGLVKGMSDTTFGVGSEITREDMAVMLYRAITELGIQMQFDAEPFADEAQIDGYAVNAVNAMKASGIINGVGDNMFQPLDSATRAQAAQIIFNTITYAE